ncbi:rRNA maturation RNase YbeY [Candidatus Shikimatogenerans bostrichidophilus]|uniref:rRNA maturation RNase YbeY n=1 Tax=Candidatus Shikimatogenerans bostrichidophilus TaxID=2943807 RepID=UPI00296692F7
MIKFFIFNKIINIYNIKTIKNIIKKIIYKENKKLYKLNYIFCNNKYILEINSKYLKKSHYTDTISFNYSNNKNIIYGDIFISYDQVLYNSIIYKQVFDTEIKIVIIHSLLHLIGYNDIDKKYLNIMNNKQNFYFYKYFFYKLKYNFL